MLGRALTLVLTLLSVAGCVAPVAVSPGPAAPSAPDAAPDGLVNQFLLDAPKPPGAAVSGGAEPMVLVDKDNGYVLIGDTSGVYKSVDGATWTRLSPSTAPGAFTDGRALAQDDAGTLYSSSTQGQAIYFSRSTNDGASWSGPTSLIEAAPIADRPWLAARGDGQVSLVYFAYPLGERCARSTDAGTTWLDRDPTWRTPNAGNVLYDEFGRLYYATANSIYRYLQPCKSGAVTLSLPASGPQIFTQVAVDSDERPYVAQPTAGSGQMTIRAFSSWSQSSYKELAVSPPELKSNTFGAISAYGDEVAVAWYGSETPGNPAGAFAGVWNVYVARVTGFWTATPTITYTRLTTEANHEGGFCMGGIGCTAGEADRDLLDYFGIDHGPDGAVHVAYGHDGTGSAAEVRHARLAP